MRFKNWLILTLTTLVAYFSSPEEGEAWNSAGHKTIASIICRRISEDRLLDLAELLTQHPRYEEDFARWLPEQLRDSPPLMRAEWMLQQASIWPDLVRSGPPEKKMFNRPQWHYFPRALFLEEPDAEFQRRVATQMNSELDPVGGTENDRLNGPQAFQANLSVLNDPTASNSDRAVALCWVLHIGQDLHQPCHTASLTMPNLFPTGDRGANSIRTEPTNNLHAVWDGPLGPNDRYETCRNLAIALVGGTDESDLEVNVQDVAAELKTWLAEGMLLERNAVYVGEVYEAVFQANARNVELEKIQLSADYLRNVRKVADRRFVLAGIRLAALLSSAPQPLGR